MKGKRKIAAAFVLTLFAGMFPQQALAAGGDYQVTLGFFDGDQVDLSDVSSSSDDQIEEGHASVYDEAGDLVSEWDLDGETRTITFEGTATEEVTDENGETTTQTVSVYRWNGEELPSAEVDALVSALNGLTVTGETTAAQGEEIITVTICQKVEGYEALTLRLTAQDAATACAEFGGETLLTDRSAADTLASSARALFED